MFKLTTFYLIIKIYYAINMYLLHYGFGVYFLSLKIKTILLMKL